MQTQLCVPIVGKTIKEIKNQINKASEKAQILEIRADYITEISEYKIQKIRNLTNQPLIFTCRPEYEGGNFQGEEDKRKDLLVKAIKLGYEYLDVEFESNIYEDIIDRAKETEIIISKHNFEETPGLSELQSLKEEMENTGADIVKLVTTANSILDNFTIFNLLQKQKNDSSDLIALCMGVYGEISRILAAKYGSLVTFAALDNDKTSAPGQIKIDEMIDIYDIENIDSETKLTGVVGKYAENSKSKYLHNPVFNQREMNYVYLPLKVDQGKELEEFISLVREFDFTGLAVTIPHKEDIMEYLDKIDQTGREIGAINTVSKVNDNLQGTNTDYVGAINSLEQKINLTDKKCLVLGAGGAARAIVYGLVNNEAQVTIVNRTESRAKELAQEFSCKTGNYNEREKIAQNFDIIINTTSVGMYPDTDNTILNNFPSDAVVLDIVYKPLETKFIKKARQAGCEVITGENMLVYQAMEQFEIWTGSRPEFETMHEAFFNIP